MGEPFQEVHQKMNKTKRANGQGCIYKEKNGTYTVIKTRGYDTQKHFR